MNSPMQTVTYDVVTIFLLISVFLNPLFAAAQIPCDGTETNPCVVQDTKENSLTVKHFRDTKMMMHSYPGNTAGLSELHMSGSSAPSTAGWRVIFNKFQSGSVAKIKNIIVVDLREESHGYLNSNAINLTSQHDWINFGKTRAQTLAAENKWLQSLAAQTTVANVLTAAQFKAGDFVHGITIPVESLMSEEALVKKLGFRYVRLTITDHMAPRAADVDRFVDLIKHLPDNTWLHIHCRGGDGRTTTFMAMYDMLKNADKIPFEEIIKRQASVDPFYDLSKVERKDPMLTVYYQARLQFLKKFYQFSKDYIHGYGSSWSDWIKNSI